MSLNVCSPIRKLKVLFGILESCKRRQLQLYLPSISACLKLSRLLRLSRWDITPTNTHNFGWLKYTIVCRLCLLDNFNSVTSTSCTRICWLWIKCMFGVYKNAVQIKCWSIEKCSSFDQSAFDWFGELEMNEFCISITRV